MAKKIMQTPIINLKEIKDLIQLLKRNNVQEFDLEREGIRIRIVTGVNSRIEAGMANSQPVIANPVMAPQVVPLTPAPVNNGPLVPVAAKKDEVTEVTEEKKVEEEKGLTTIKSPMVGTFYRAPSPESPPYVEVGDEVQEDTVLCIVEAMKLMNEIKAETQGKVHKIMVENGQPVEYGQPLFLIEPLTD